MGDGSGPEHGDRLDGGAYLDLELLHVRDLVRGTLLYHRVRFQSPFGVSEQIGRREDLRYGHAEILISGREGAITGLDHGAAVATHDHGLASRQQNQRLVEPAEVCRLGENPDAVILRIEQLELGPLPELIGSAARSHTATNEDRPIR